MTPELERADRAEAVRSAARGWRRAGAIDDSTLAAVEARFPDDRVRVGPVFRVLLFLFTLLAVGAGYGLIVVSAQPLHDEGLAVAALLFGGALAVATEVQIVRLRRRQGGTEAATSCLAIGFLLAAAAWYFLSQAGLEARNGFPLFWLTAGALLAAAAWRWGYPLYAGAATVALLFALARLPLGRLLWIALPLAAAPWLLRLAESARLPPAHRRSLTAVLLVALTGLYAAVHIGSWEAQWIEETGGSGPGTIPPSDLLWWAALLGTALVPLALLAFGIRSRRYPFLLLGAGSAVASLVTLRYYVHLAPLWVVITASGALLVAAVEALRRFLESGPAGERRGFTAAPLFQDAARLRLLEAAAAAVTLAPDARSLPKEPKFEGGGGEFGGGGASGQY